MLNLAQMIMNKYHLNNGFLRNCRFSFVYGATRKSTANEKKKATALKTREREREIPLGFMRKSNGTH